MTCPMMGRLSPLTARWDPTNDGVANNDSPVKTLLFRAMQLCARYRGFYEEESAAVINP